eukprot:CAMPEP_0201999944 /NCGR_PEP_ID=MMETSP0905-20130828/6378_1 /ASSEMBLY_ACC=CAM_ASM_000554 /TAXON_ID=420261 /ORGANISM="Thalassiosira antarctica, Strain CCMP982" /LENGTH=147 /DNA_ID=CAMNT_0048556277 /DNA_START=209 /DNA_END=648 /DNA_ORIENTATION=-
MVLGGASDSSDDVLIIRQIGSAFPDPDAPFCYNLPYSNGEGVKKQLGTVADCVTSEIVPNLIFAVFYFNANTTFTPEDEDKDELITQCSITSSLQDPVDAVDGFNAMTECFNETGVLSGMGGSVQVDGLVDNTKFGTTGELRFDLTW